MIKRLKTILPPPQFVEKVKIYKITCILIKVCKLHKDASNYLIDKIQINE